MRLKAGCSLATKTEPATVPYGNVGEVKVYSFGSERALGKCEYFDVLLLRLSGKKEISSQNDFISLLIIEGAVSISYEGGEFKAEKGASIFIPKGLKTVISGNAEIICSKCK